jgi:hypothetical protein
MRSLLFACAAIVGLTGAAALSPADARVVVGVPGFAIVAGPRHHDHWRREAWRHDEWRHGYCHGWDCRR